jgi:peptide/nickel transport system permease protein
MDRTSSSQGAPAGVLWTACRLPQGWSRRLDLLIPSGLLLTLFGLLLCASLLPIPAPIGGDVLSANLPIFSPGHFLGTDRDGNDIFSRLLYGGRTSVLIALVVNAMGLLIGGTLGALAAYLGGLADAILMRILDVLIAFPPLILVLAVAQALQPSELNTVWALSFFTVPAFARVARASTLRLREQAFMTAAQLGGSSLWRILRRHIAPNIIPQLTTFALLGMGGVINIEGAVSFLGLGVPLPQPSWGNMIYQGQLTLAASPAPVLLPSACLLITVLAFNLLSDAVHTRWSES